MLQLTFSTSRVGAVTVLSVAGEIDISNVAQLTEALDPLGSERVVVALDKVAYIDSSGLTALVRSHKQHLSSGVPQAIVLPAPPADRVFEVTNLIETLNCFRELESALAVARADA